MSKASPRPEASDLARQEATSSADGQPQANQQPEPIVVTVPEAAVMLRLDRRTVRELFHRGEIAGNQRGHAIRLSRTSVVDWASGRCASGSKGKTR